jgi:hypothetical protein
VGLFGYVMRFGGSFKERVWQQLESKHCMGVIGRIKGRGIVRYIYLCGERARNVITKLRYLPTFLGYCWNSSLDPRFHVILYGPFAHVN